jgi:hypothetical protein
MDSIEERVAFYLAANDHLCAVDQADPEYRETWWRDNDPKFRADYLAHARNVIALIQPDTSLPPEQSSGYVETPIGHARNTALAIVTALLDSDDDTAWSIARSPDHDPVTLAMILARVVAQSTTPEAWRQIAMEIADGTA